MEKCSPGECLDFGIAKVGESWYCYRHLTDKRIADAVAAGGMALCVERCLADRPQEFIKTLPTAGKGECPRCHQTGWLRILSAPH